MSPQSRRWVFTHNNYTQDDIASWKDYARRRCKYLVFGEERAPTTGTRHLQGFLIGNSAIRFGSLKREFPTCNFQAAHATSAQCAEYAKKDGIYWEHGQVPIEQGKRSDLQSFVDWGDTVIAAQQRAPSSREIARERPIQYLSQVRARRLFELRAPDPVLQLGDPQPWQGELEAHLEEPPDDRVINFYVDPIGGKGKTWFIRYYVSKYPDKTQVLGVGKKTDVAHMIDPEKSVFLFNCARGEMEFFQYSIVEHLKDQMIFSPKYSGRMKFLRSVPHVVVFCNEYPDRTKLTDDRFNIINLS